MSSHSTSHSAFFYGTLMAPQVLHRVIHGSSTPTNAIHAASTLTTQPALLYAHRRHRVKHADYPAILPTPSDPSSTVRGTFATGLTAADIYRLDLFEGSDYSRRIVRVKLLSTVGDESGAGNVEGDEVTAETYVWISGKAALEEREWDFAEFQREKMRYWVGMEGAGEYAEVDEAVAAEQQRDGTGGRGANGYITQALEEEHRKGEKEVLRNAV